MNVKILALLLAAGIAFTPAPASAQVCGVGIIIAAFAVNAQEHRELTEKEAATCGLMVGHDRENVKKMKSAHKKKHKHRKKSRN
jgi:hypothetical protein